MSSSNIIIAHPTEDKLESLKAFLKALKIKFEVAEQDKLYNPDFVAKIEKSKEQFKKGNYSVIKTEDLWK